MERPDIFDYSDFRLYLNDLFNFRYSEDKKFNKAYVCKMLGLENSRSYFQDIINGKYLSPIKVPLMTEVFELNKGETKYFRILVNYNQAFDEPDERELYFEQLLSLKRASGREVDTSQYEYYTRWYHSVIRATLDIIDATESDIALIRKQLIPEISSKQVEESLALLAKLDLIFVDERGFLKPSDTIIRTPQYCRDEAVIRYQMQILEQAQHVYPAKSKSGMNKRTITKILTFSAEGNKRVESAIDRFSNEINTIVSEDEDEPDRIYQMLITLFPYTKSTGKLSPAKGAQR